jgi:hypothetical protein
MSGYLTHRPSAGRITWPFGAPPATPTSPPAHLGQDYGWGNGFGVYAARAGIVVAAEYSGAYGNRVIVDHGAGIRTWYCHLSRFLVGVGDEVAGGDDVGTKGATGNVTATHLHFELRIDGRAVDPEPYFTSSTPAGVVTEPIREEDMPLNAETDYDAFKTMLQRALRYEVRPNGAGATWEHGPTVWERLATIERAIVAAARPDIDETALASQLAPLIDFDALDDDELDRLAERVVDAHARRLTRTDG